VVYFEVLTPQEAEACGGEAGSACLWMYRTTDSVSLARAADWLVAKPAKIVLIIVLAFVAYRIVSRAITGFVRSVDAGSMQRGLSVLSDGSAATALGPRARQRAETLGVVLRSLAKAIIAVIAILMILGELGLNLGPLLAGAGIVGIALGFGSQSLVKDFLSGVFMLIEDQFGVGDIIDSGYASGVVEAVTLRTTRLRDVEGTVWHVPNGEIRRIGNKSQQWSRALLDIDVAYDTDLQLAKDTIKSVADQVWKDETFGPSVLEEPELWGVESFGSNGIAIRLVVKTLPADQWKVMRELRQRIKLALDEAGIEIAFAQRGLWPTP